MEFFCYIKPTKKHGTFGCLGIKGDLKVISCIPHAPWVSGAKSLPKALHTGILKGTSIRERPSAWEAFSSPKWMGDSWPPKRTPAPKKKTSLVDDTPTRPHHPEIRSHNSETLKPISSCKAHVLGAEWSQLFHPALG